jgi:ribosome biogenesis GTPase A
MLLEDEKGVDKTDRMLRMCVMGRPNVGKSTMINKILERMEDGEGKRAQEEGKGKGEEIGRLLTGREPKP